MSPHDDLSRRQFLVQSASLAGAASLGLATTRSARGASLDDEVRVGMIGLGDRGRQLLGSVLGVRGVRVVALCDVDPKNLKRGLDICQQRAQRVPGAELASPVDLSGTGRPRSTMAVGNPAVGNPRGFTNYRALLDAADVDAVFIATPVCLHAEQSVTSLAAGKHVYCEKPLAMDADACLQVLAACSEAERRGQLYQCGLQRRYNPRYRESLRFLHSGEAGDVLFVRAQWHAVGGARKSKPWLTQRDKSGDIVLEQAVHQFDIFNWIFDAPPIRAQGMGGAHHSQRNSGPAADTFDHYAAILEYPGGAKVQLSHLTYAIPDRRMSGIYELAFCERTGVDLANAVTWDANGKRRELCRQRGNETQLAVESFVSDLVEGRRPQAGANQAFHAALAAILCRRAIDEGRTVTYESILGGSAGSIG